MSIVPTDAASLAVASDPVARSDRRASVHVVGRDDNVRRSRRGVNTLTCACQKYSGVGWPIRCAACGRDDMTARGPAAAVELGTLPAGATSSTATGAASGRELGEVTDRGGSTIDGREVS